MKPESNNGYLRSTVTAEESELLPPAAREVPHIGTPLQVSKTKQQYLGIALVESIQALLNGLDRY